jgi:phage gp45-like
MFDRYPENHDSLLGVVRRAVALGFDDAKAQQFITRLRGMAGDEPENVYRLQGFGLSSVPPVGSEGLVIGLGGRSDRLLGLGFEHKDHRPVGSKPGTTVLYDDKGNIVFVKGANGIEVRAKAGKVTVTPADGEKVFLGGDGENGAFAQVVTLAGPSINVYARIG